MITFPAIRVFRNYQQDCWMADFVGDSMVFQHFGTTKLPTPFRLIKPVAEVITALREKNPNCVVFYEEGL